VIANSVLRKAGHSLIEHGIRDHGGWVAADVGPLRGVGGLRAGREIAFDLVSAAG